MKEDGTPKRLATSVAVHFCASTMVLVSRSDRRMGSYFIESSMTIVLYALLAPEYSPRRRSLRLFLTSLDVPLGTVRMPPRVVPCLKKLSCSFCEFLATSMSLVA